jgi:hypothetical protein
MPPAAHEKCSSADDQQCQSRGFGYDYDINFTVAASNAGQFCDDQCCRKSQSIPCWAETIIGIRPNEKSDYRLQKAP